MKYCASSGSDRAFTPRLAAIRRLINSLFGIISSISELLHEEIMRAEGEDPELCASFWFTWIVPGITEISAVK